MALAIAGRATAEVERIEVIGHRPATGERNAPTSFVSIIPVDEHPLEIETVPDLLSQSAGVHVRRFGGLGAFSTISIRGSDSNQVQFYLDEVPLSQAQHETVNLATLPLDSLDHIEVYRGTIPVTFGGGGTAGVVNLVTRAPSVEPETNIQASFGSFLSRKLSATHSRRVAGFDVLGHFTYLGSKGDFTFESDNGTPNNPDDDHTATRKNNESNMVSGLFKASHPLGDAFAVDLTEEFSYEDRGVPGADSPQTRKTNLQQLRSLTHLRLRGSDWLTRGCDVSASFFGVYHQQDFDDPLGELGVVQDTRNRTGAFGINGNLRYDALPYNNFLLFAETAYEIFAPYNGTLPEPDGPDQTRLRITAALQDEIDVFTDRIVLVPALRYQHLRDSFSGADVAGRPTGDSETKSRNLLAPSLGLIVWLQDWLSVRGNLGRFQRVPNFSELFGNTGTVTPNPDLKPEKATNRDIGFLLEWGNATWLERVRLEYAYFNNDVDDLIAYRQVRANLFEARNFDDARIRGHELSGDLALLEYFRFTANYTRQDAENLSRAPSEHGKQIPVLPRDEVYARAEIHDDRRALYYEYALVGESFTGASNLRRLGSRDTHTLGATWQILDWLGVGFEARNFTANDVRDLFDFPLPGRVFLGTLRIDL